MSQSTVSIIIPTLNESKYVDSTLHSIATQTYRDIELIVVDGQSTDDTIEKIQRFEEDFQRVEILVNKPRVNQSFARNRGLMHANGEYIVFHDADDLSVSSRVEQQVQFLKSHPDVGAVGSSFYYINPNRGERTIRNRPTEHEAIRKALAKSCPIHIGSAMFRREALTETHLFKSEYAEIYEILIDMVAKGWKLRNLEEPLFVYRINEGSISREGQLEQKVVLLKRNYQAVTRLGLSPLNLFLSLGWFVYMYSPPEVKRIVRQVFAPDDDQQLTEKQERILNDLLDEHTSPT